MLWQGDEIRAADHDYLNVRPPPILSFGQVMSTPRGHARKSWTCRCIVYKYTLKLAQDGPRNHQERFLHFAHPLSQDQETQPCPPLLQRRLTCGLQLEGSCLPRLLPYKHLLTTLEMRDQARRMQVSGALKSRPHFRSVYQLTRSNFGFNVTRPTTTRMQSLHSHLSSMTRIPQKSINLQRIGKYPSI